MLTNLQKCMLIKPSYFSKYPIFCWYINSFKLKNLPTCFHIIQAGQQNNKAHV